MKIKHRFKCFFSQVTFASIFTVVLVFYIIVLPLWEFRKIVKYFPLFCLTSFAGLSVLFLVFHIVKPIFKKNKYFYKISESSLTYILMLSCFVRQFCSRIFIATTFADTPTYVSAGLKFLNLKIDSLRTPVYPLFLNLLGMKDTSYDTLHNPQLLDRIVLVQNILSLASVVFLYFALTYIFKSKKIILAVSILYSCNIYFIIWDYCVLTECFSLIGTVLYIFFLALYLKKPSATMGVVIGLHTFVLLMIRPSFLVFMAITAVFWIVRLIFEKSSRKSAAFGLAAVVLSFVLMQGYSVLNYNQNGFNGVSHVHQNVNQLCIFIEDNQYRNPEYPDIEKFIDENVNMNDAVSIWLLTNEINEKFGLARTSEYSKSTVKLHYRSFVISQIRKVIENADRSLVTKPANFDNKEKHLHPNKEKYLHSFFNALAKTFVPINFFMVVIICGASIFMGLRVWIKTKKTPYVLFGLSALVIATLFTVFYGSMGEFSRLALIAVPMVTILVFHTYEQSRVLNMMHDKTTK